VTIPGRPLGSFIEGFPGFFRAAKGSENIC